MNVICHPTAHILLDMSKAETLSACKAVNVLVIYTDSVNPVAVASGSIAIRI